jgi:hypothetical protein
MTQQLPWDDVPCSMCRHAAWSYAMMPLLLWNQNPAAAYRRPMQMFLCRASHLLHFLFRHLLLRAPLTRTVPDGPALPPRPCR